jgi:hypothetical protein
VPIIPIIRTRTRHSRHTYPTCDNIIANFQTTNHTMLSCQSAFTSRFSVTAPKNGYSSARFSQYASRHRLLAMEIIQLPALRSSCHSHPLINTPHLNFQLNSSKNSLQDNTSTRTTQRTLLLCGCRGVITAQLYSNGRGADYMENTVFLLLHVSGVT